MTPTSTAMMPTVTAITTPVSSSIAPLAANATLGGSGLTPLGAFTRIEQTTMPLSVNHQGQFPVVTVSFNLARSAALGDAVEAIDKAKAELGMPASIQGSFQGTAAAFEASLKNEPLLILAALVTVYIVLGVLYESYIHPITILSTLPSAGVGALVALLLCHADLSVIALIGIILLIGIVKKNAIMMIDFALEAERQRGMAPYEAIYEACLLRFRPIMMTTMAALLGAVPLAMGYRRRFGAAPAAGHHDHRRTDLQPDPDALHHAGDLPLVRPRGPDAGHAQPRAVHRTQRCKPEDA